MMSPELRQSLIIPIFILSVFSHFGYLLCLWSVCCCNFLDLEVSIGRVWVVYYIFVKLLILFFRILTIILFSGIFHSFFQVFFYLNLSSRYLFFVHPATLIPSLHPQHLQMMILDLLWHLLDSTAVYYVLLHLKLRGLRLWLQLELPNIIVNLLETLIPLCLKDFFVHLLTLEVRRLEVVQKMVILPDTCGERRISLRIDVCVVLWTAHIN